MKDISIEVPFVRGKDRPRFIRKTGRVYTPLKTVQAMKAIKDAYLEAGGEKAPSNVAVYMHITAVRPIPKSKPKKLEWEFDLFKPDADNIGKLVMDALNGIAYGDDAQVVELSVHKCPRIKDMREHMLIWIHWEEADDGDSD